MRFDRRTTTTTTTGPAARKRKRSTTVTSTATLSAAASGSAVIKKEEEEEQYETEKTTPTTKPRRARKPARATTDADSGTKTVKPPSDWEEMYEVVRAMRRPGGAASRAAVDHMGCERLADEQKSPRVRRFHTLTALMLSSQTKDTTNAEAMARLRAELPPCDAGAEPGLTLENMLVVDPAVLNELIRKVGFHNNKTKYLKQTAEILRDKHGSDIPDTIEGLMSLPGVGPKMAYLCMSADGGWGRTEGVGVDTHVHRITNLWGWQSPPTKTPEQTRLALQAWLPHDRWKEINWLLVGLGQTVCLPVGRRCGECELGLRGLCKAADRKKVGEGRRTREQQVKTEGGGTSVVKEESVEEKVLKDVVVKYELVEEKNMLEKEMVD